MKKSTNLPARLAAICGIIALGLATQSLAQACSGTWLTARLKVGEQYLELDQHGSNKRCVMVFPTGTSGPPWIGHFDIRVIAVGGYSVVLGDIQACSKDTSPLPSSACPAPDASDPVTFEVVGTKSSPKRVTVEVRVNDAASADDQGYDIHVPGVGTLDPAVQIIRTTSRMLFLESVEQVLQENFDENVLNDAAFDSFRDELKDLKNSGE